MLNSWLYRTLIVVALGLTMVLQACGGGGSTAATVVVPAPNKESNVIAFSQTLSTTKNNPIDITLTGQSDAVGALTFDVYTMPTNGTLTGQLAGIKPTMTYTPSLDFYGTDSFTFNVIDVYGNTGTGTISIHVLNSAAPLADTDGDGLLDLDEINKYKTNPNLADTDGDGFNDFQEAVTFAFDKGVNNFRFNPLIADMPEIDIQLVSQPNIQLNYTTTSGSSSTISTNRSVSSSTSTSHSKSYTSTWSSSVSHEAGVSLTVGVEEEVSFGSSGIESVNKFSASITGHYTNTNTEGHEKSTSWDDTTTHENSSTLDKGQAFESNHSISTSDGDILVSAKVVNTGHVAYTLNNLYLNASYFDGTSKQPYVPIGTLSYDGGSGFPTVALSPGQSTGVLTFRTSPLNIDTVKKLLADSRGMSIRPSIYDMLDQNGVSYNFSSTGIGTQTALVKIDYIGNGGRKNITKRVAVHGDPSKTVTVDQILNSILNVNAVVVDAYGNPSQQGIIGSVDGLANRDPYGFWIMIHGKNQGNNQMITTTYTTPRDRSDWIVRGNLDPYTTSIVDHYDLSQITVNAGDVLHLFYMQDEDLDGLPNVQEFFYRSDPLSKDTDGDGLEDSVEVKGWDVTWEDANHSFRTQRFYSSPTLVDTDGDGLSDDVEANLANPSNANRRNPRAVDTDGDSIVDGIDDMATGGVLNANAFQNLNVSHLATTVTQATANASVMVSYTLPASLYAMPNHGYSSYTVAVYSLVDAAANFSEPAQPPANGVIPIVGDTLPCQSGLCNWTAVNVYQTGAGAANQPTGPVASHTFTDNTTLLTANTSVKYIAYVAVDGIWKANPLSVIASSNSEIIRFTVHDGWMANVKTIVGPNHHADTSGTTAGVHDSSNPNWYYIPKGTAYYCISVFSNSSGWFKSCPSGWYSTNSKASYLRYDIGYGVTPDNVLRGSQWVDGTNPKEYVTDINGTYIQALTPDYWEPPMTYPFSKGDGQVDLRWWLHVDNVHLYDSPTLAIDGTFRENKAADDINPVADAIPTSGGVPIYSGAPSVFVNQTDPAFTYPATGVFEIELPATQQCYQVDIGAAEVDGNLPRGINLPSDYDSVLDLCRDNSLPGFGIWTLTDRKTGAVVGSTRKGNAFPVTFNGYVYWRDVPPANQSVPWKGTTGWHAVTKSVDLYLGFDMQVR